MDSLIASPPDKIAEPCRPKGFQELPGGHQDDIGNRGHILQVRYNSNISVPVSKNAIIVFTEYRNICQRKLAVFIYELAAQITENMAQSRLDRHEHNLVAFETLFHRYLAGHRAGVSRFQQL